MKECYDFVFPLGAGCSCSMMLREKDLQLASFPLDWVGTPDFGAAGDIRVKAELVANGFKGWFLEENLERAPQYDSPKFLSYLDRGTGLYFTHDFEHGADIHREYPEASAKYARRIERFHKLLSGSRRVLAVWVNDPRIPGEVGEEDIAYCLDVLRKAYPGVAFKVIVVNCAHGVKPEEMRRSIGDGFECYAFDYRVVTDGEPTWDIRRDLFAPLFERFSVRDYRTKSERRANARRERARDMEKFHATSSLDLVFTKMKFKLYRHLKRSLERKGVIDDNVQNQTSVIQ